MAKKKETNSVVEESTVSTIGSTKKEKPQKEARMVEIFTRQDLYIDGLKPMLTHIRYAIPEDRLADLPENSYKLIK